MTTQAESLLPCERCGELRSNTCTDCVIKHEMNGCLGKPHPVPATPPSEELDSGEALALTAEEEQTLRDHAATDDLWLSTDFWGGTMIRRLLATLDAARAATPPTAGLGFRVTMNNADHPRQMLVKLPPIGADGHCTGCGKEPSRETGSCGCHFTVAARLATSPTSED